MAELVKMNMLLISLFLNTITASSSHATASFVVAEEEAKGFDSSGTRVINVTGVPDSVVWVVQLSDLHFSVHHPDRALDFRKLVGPALFMINPSLVLITGDLTDAKSKDLLTMKQNEQEWQEYKSVLEDVIKTSGLDMSTFFDLRGNHDNFGVPVVGGSYDFFSKYSISGQLGRNRSVNGVTLETGDRKHLFVGFDSTMNVGVRGPTNFFGHPTDQLLNNIDLELSQWDSEMSKPVTKIAFGHFPLSFSVPSGSGKTLRDVFLRHSLSSYLCGHLHTRFGKNLKRHHQSSHQFFSTQKLFQLNTHQTSSERNVSCLSKSQPINEFWEWEMGDWRKSRVMRILAIDGGYVSYLDFDFKSGSKKTIILPTFPLDSHFMVTSCQTMVPSSRDTIRALVFSVSPIVSVVARVYDSRPGNLKLVLESHMIKHVKETSRGDLYIAPWNYQAFEDPSPDRFLLQIEATDIMGRLTQTELRPFSMTGWSATISWTWKEFMVMGCPWAVLYYPILWTVMCLMFVSLLLPKALLIFSNKIYTYKNFIASKGFINCTLWILQELCMFPILWFSLLGYLFYLILFPWIIGKVFTDGQDSGYMTYMGWVIKTHHVKGKHQCVGSPDVMMVVLPHLLLVVLPALLVICALAVERRICLEHIQSLSKKKKEDHDKKFERSISFEGSRQSNIHDVKRRLRKLICIFCLAICWKHFMNCRTLMRAYGMNSILHFLAYGPAVPLLLACAVFETRSL